MKAACCRQEITIQTDPKNCEYVIISGAQKKTEDFDVEDAETFELPADEGVHYGKYRCCYYYFFVYVNINLVCICPCSLKHVIASFNFIIEVVELAIDLLGLAVFYGFCPFNKFNVFFT